EFRQSSCVSAAPLGRGSLARRLDLRLRLGLGSAEFPPPLRRRGDSHRAGLWLGNPLLLSSQAVSSLVADVVWAVDAGSRLFLGRHVFGGTEYMFDASFPLAVRLLSLFHVVWPPLLLWSLRRVGYDRRGLALQIAIAGALLIVSRFAGRAANLNFAFRDPIWGLSLEPAPLHLAATLAFIVAVFYLPVHLALSRAFPRPQSA